MRQNKFRGVSSHKDIGFVAKIKVHRKQVYLGLFTNFESAKAARIKAEIDLYGTTFECRKKGKAIVEAEAEAI